MYDLLAELKASGSQAIGTVNGATKDLGPGGVRPIKPVACVTVVGSSATLTLKVQQSSDGSTWYDIPGGSFLDPSAGAVIDATGKYEIFIKLTSRYVRYVGVVATAAVTYEVLLTKV